MLISIFISLQVYGYMIFGKPLKEYNENNLTIIFSNIDKFLDYFSTINRTFYDYIASHNQIFKN